MLFSWLKQRRRKKLLAEPFPAAWLEILERNVQHYRRLTAEDQARLRDHLRIFIAERNWEGCAGLQLTDEMQVTIAAQACLLLLGLEHDYYPRVMSILVYPAGYVGRDEQLDEHGMLHGSEARLGEAWYRGPVILSWADVLRGSRQGVDGQNLVLHEFAHQLDMEDRSIDGTPPLASREQYRHWNEVMTAEYERLVDAAERGRATLLDQYGATDPGEFFAVATECFFERSAALCQRHPKLYAVLRDFYHQDPATRRGDSVQERGK